MIIIKKRFKTDNSWAIFKNGQQVNTIVKIGAVGDWVLLLNDNRFTDEESIIIHDKLNELNATFTPYLDNTPD